MIPFNSKSIFFLKQCENRFDSTDMVTNRFLNVKAKRKTNGCVPNSKKKPNNASEIIPNKILKNSFGPTYLCYIDPRESTRI